MTPQEASRKYWSGLNPNQRIQILYLFESWELRKSRSKLSESDFDKLPKIVQEDTFGYAEANCNQVPLMLEVFN